MFGIHFPRFLGLSMCTLAVGIAFSPAAEAHAHLMTSLPAADTTTAAPGQIELRFSEAPLAGLSGVELQTASGAIVPVASKGLGKNMLVVVPQHPLKAGNYTVKWHVVAADTHRSQGTFAFTVR